MPVNASEVVIKGKRGNPDIIECSHVGLKGGKARPGVVRHSSRLGCAYCEDETPRIRVEAVGAAK